ncbi:hypothetical protein [Nocardia sp. XZ_19_369]|nr:hypothetical protein [Nocardia sp. XZ_19_369]
MGRLYTAVATLTYAITVIVIYDTIVTYARHQVFAELRGSSFGRD